MNAQLILNELDARLNMPVELTLYGRAAIQLGFKNPPEDALLSMDVDAVFWIGQAEQLNEKTNFWEAVEQVNRALGEQGLYISHFFEEDMVILRPDWKERRAKIESSFRKIDLFRLSDVDLLLSKLMRDDPQDQQDALFITKEAGLSLADIQSAIQRARIPPIPEIIEEFKKASRRLLKAFSDS